MLSGGYLNLGLSYIVVSLGTPPQRFRLHVDTASSTTGIYSTLCPAAMCNFDGNEKLYSMSASSTSKPGTLQIYSNHFVIMLFYELISSAVPCSDSLCTGIGTTANPKCLTQPTPTISSSQCSFNVFYADQTAMVGVYTQDTMTIGTMSAPVYFGRISTISSTYSTSFEPSGVDGIIGLAFAAGNCNPSCYPTVLDGFVAANQMPYFFAMCLQPTFGNIDFGVVDPAKYSGTIQYLPLIVSPTNVLSRYYTVNQQSLRIGSKSITLASPQQAIFDSGTTLMVLTKSVFSSLSSVCRTAGYAGARNLFSGYAVALSASQIASWPQLTFSFATSTGGTFSISLSSSQYLVPWVEKGISYVYLGIDWSSNSMYSSYFRLRIILLYIHLLVVLQVYSGRRFSAITLRRLRPVSVAFGCRPGCQLFTCVFSPCIRLFPGTVPTYFLRLCLVRSGFSVAGRCLDVVFSMSTRLVCRQFWLQCMLCLCCRLVQLRGWFDQL
jgi:hypothetical protein